MVSVENIAEGNLSANSEKPNIFVQNFIKM